MKKTGLLVFAWIVAFAAIGCGQFNPPSGTSPEPIVNTHSHDADEIQGSGEEQLWAFSYEQELDIYPENHPGVKYTGFHNISAFDIHNGPDAVERAKSECTIQHDMADVYVDETAGMWKIVFYTDGMPGGCQSVYLDSKGITRLIVYGE